MHLRYALATTLLLAACSDSAGFPDATPIDAPPPDGTVSLNWTVTDTSGAAITCDRVNGQTVTLEIHNEDASGGFTEVFSCDSDMGTTPAELPPGTYDITIFLKAPGNLVLAQTAPVQGIVVKPAMNTALPDQVFAVDATGAVALHLTANQSGGNCAPTASMGAGISGMTLTLVQSSDGTCAPELLMVAAGATTSAFTYQIDCTTPPVAPCIETDQAITVASMSSGAYQIHVRGRGTDGTTECWQNDDSLVVPAAANTLTATLNLGATGNSGCM
ncbi:MAG TPA: hypothetical protein VGM88_02545 [Kofleriaceae bacterium]|jgi:hypothetical protein